ncbi:DUF5753 domain-containing protein [Streptomyces sp. NPDC058686]|uniref:DUF5753 domain-containing protein n=1 Tax=Streptomyces sp. NPDC058686 TaxID=3346599 RepID=UPI0036548FC6
MLPLFEATRWFRFYQSWVIPGLLQTDDYTRAVLATAVHLRDIPGGIDEAVQARAHRKHVLHRPGRRFSFLIEEPVLRTRIAETEVMVAQLAFLLAATTSMPSVSLGIIPMTAERATAWPVESFAIYDEAQVSTELVSANLTVTQPREIDEYAKNYSALHGIAVYGAHARRLITAAIDALERPCASR